MPKKINLLGQRFGRLVVIASVENKGKRSQWLCQCDCGNTKIILTDSLKNGKTQSCGCLKKEQLIQKNKERSLDLIGQRFGKLTVIEQAESYREHSAWKCKCDCGNEVIVNSIELKKGDTLSCGCLRSSYGEQLIENILKNNNIPYKKEFTFADLVSDKNAPLRFDFAIFNTDGSLSHLIEYDGEQHFSTKGDNIVWSDSLQIRQLHDQYKNEYCKLHNIPLIRINYQQKQSLQLEQLLISS